MKVKIVINETVTLRQWFRHHYPHIEYARLQQSIRVGDVQINNKKLPPQTVLTPGDICTVWDKLLLNNPAPIPKDLCAKVISSNEHFWVFDKSYGIATQGGTGIKFSMIDIASSMMGKPAYCVHRLDRYTTGILVMACDSYSARDLSESLQQNTWKKVYLAKIAPGDYPDYGEIDEPVYNKTALTRYKVIERYSDYSLVSFVPVTGRMHQIRWHSASALKPLLGDIKFGSECRTRMFLRCVKLELIFRQEKMSFEC